MTSPISRIVLWFLSDWTELMLGLKLVMGLVMVTFHSVQFSSITQSCWTLCDPIHCSTPGFLFTISRSLLKLTSIESVMPSNHLVLCCPLLLLPSIFPNIRIFFKEVSSSYQVAKLSELQFQHQSFQWIFRFDVLQDRLVWFPCHLRDSQESSPTRHELRWIL